MANSVQKICSLAVVVAITIGIATLASADSSSPRESNVLIYKENPRMSDSSRYELARLFARYSIVPRDKLSGGEAVLLDIGDPRGRTEEQIAQDLLGTDGVAIAEPNYLVPVEATIPNDPNFIDQWQWSKINAPDAWDTTTGNPNVIVAVVDTGVDVDHPDLVNQLLPGINLANSLNANDWDDIQGHGTFIAGLYGETANNGVGGSGLNWNIKILPVRVSEAATGSATMFSIGTGIDWAVNHGARVINVSYSRIWESAYVLSMAAVAKSKGALVVTCAGNQGLGNVDNPSPDLIVVGATDANDLRAGFSNYGPKLDLTAPGVDVFSTAIGGYRYWSGTSFSSPMTAALAALIWSVDPYFSPDEVEDIILTTSEDLGAPGRDDQFGWGRIDAKRAIAKALVEAGQNHIPTVDAGPDQTILLSQTATLDATANDDGRPSSPGALTYLWEKTSGPGNVSFANAASLDTTVTFSATGVYVLRLTVDDGALSASDFVTVMVHVANSAPIVSAGQDFSVTLPNSGFLGGQASDDGLPARTGGLTYLWEKVTGPAPVTMFDPQSVGTVVTFSVPGIYVMRLTVNDGELTGSDDVMVTVQGGNQPPVVNAGLDQTIVFPNLALLAGTVTDDGFGGIPVGNAESTVTSQWSMTSGPGSVVFGDPSAVNTTVSFSGVGDYVLTLTASDGALQGSDSLIVHVLSQLPSNSAPVVSAGPDQTITLPNSAALDATVIDDGLPGASLEVTWSQISGPGNVAFSDVHSVDTTAVFSAPGLYELQLLVSDGQLTSSDLISINVAAGGPSNPPFDPPGTGSGGPQPTSSTGFDRFKNLIKTGAGETMQIAYEMGTAGDAEISIFDRRGARITTLVNGPVSAGPHTIEWTGRAASGDVVASGVYLLRFRAAGINQTVKVIVVK